MLERGFRVKKLDSLGMKYTNQIFGIFTLCLATFLGASRLQAQSAYVSGAPSYAAETSNSDDNQGALVTLHSRVNEVNVLFIATDKHGKFVRDLNQSDFSILDDHKPPQAIINFRRETDLPLHLGLLIDVSGSVDSRFDFEQDAATTFLQRTLRVGFDKAFVAGFNSHSQMAQDFTDNVSLLVAGVHKLHDGGNGAVRCCLSRLQREISERPPGPSGAEG